MTLRDAGHICTIPWDPDMRGRLLPLDAEPREELELLCSTWMDDLSMLLRTKDSHELLSWLSAGATALIDTCLEHAILPLGRAFAAARSTLVPFRNLQALHWFRKIFYLYIVPSLDK